MQELKKMWRFKLERYDKKNIIFSNNRLFLTSGNVLLCFSSKGICWNRKVHATFYRDPYCDVSISALDAAEGYVAVGTNFMDGKLHLFNENGKLLWEHQFATIASLGWRPEDVTAIRIKRPYIAVGTEFTNEYLYVCTTARNRVFEKRIRGRVEDISFMDDRLIVGTDSYLYSFSLTGENECIVDMPAKKVEVSDNLIFVVNSYGVFAFKPSHNARIKKYWSVKIDSRNMGFCMMPDGILLALENRLNLISRRGDLIWDVEFNVPVKSIFFDEILGRVYVGVDGGIEILTPSGEFIGHVDTDGEVVKIGRMDGIVALERNESLESLTLRRVEGFDCIF